MKLIFWFVVNKNQQLITIVFVLLVEIIFLDVAKSRSTFITISETFKREQVKNVFKIEKQIPSTHTYDFFYLLLNIPVAS